MLLFDVEGCSLESKERPSCAEKDFGSVITSTIQPTQNEESIQTYQNPGMRDKA